MATTTTMLRRATAAARAERDAALTRPGAFVLWLCLLCLYLFLLPVAAEAEGARTHAARAGAAAATAPAVPFVP